MIIVFTGFSAGLLHVLMGPDHIAALAPVALDKPNEATKIGLRWGFGHSVSVMLLGAVGMFARNAVDLDKIAAYSELSIGFLLIVIGVWALRRAQGFTLHTHTHAHDGNEHQHVHIHTHGHNAQPDHTAHKHAAFSVGLLHGAAGSGQLFGLLPALALSNTDATIYLTAYLLATVMTMAAVGRSLGWLIRVGGSDNFRRILYTSAILSIAIGGLWIWFSVRHL